MLRKEKNKVLEVQKGINFQNEPAHILN